MWTAVTLFEWLVQNQFLDANQAQVLQPLLPNYADAQTFARDLLQRDWLTPFQANQILTGKGEQLILGTYRLMQRIGEGSMGQVYKAWNTRMHRIVAVKTILKEHVASTKAMERFRREMETAAQLDHPHIVHVRDADEIDGRPFLVMDFVPGENLSSIVKTKGPLPVHLAADYIRQAAAGLHHAFERGIVHRDIKPGNLLLTKVTPPQQPSVQILDFGLARFQAEQTPMDSRLTQFGNILGTIDYIAPEQAEDARVADVRSDIFSLGCSFYFLLTGKPPYPGSTPVEKISSRLVGDTPSVRELRPEVAPALDAVLRKMMARRSADRYQSPMEVALALQGFNDPRQATLAVAAPSASPSPPMAMPTAAPVQAVPHAMPVAAVVPPVVNQAPAPAPMIPNLEIPEKPAQGTHDPTLPWRPALQDDVTMLSEQVEENPFADAEAGFAPVSPMGMADEGDTSIPSDEESSTPISRRAPAKTGKIPTLYLILGGVGVFGVFTLICAGIIFRVFFPANATAKKGYPPDATLTISRAEFSLPVMIPGEQKRILVEIRRSKFEGPVFLHVEDLPDSVTAEKRVKLERGATKAEIKFSVAGGTAPMEQKIRVVAVAENLSDERTLNLVIKDKRK